MTRPPLVGITIDCPDPEALAAFWGPFLGYERRPDQPQEEGGQYATLYKPTGLPGIHHVTFQQVPEPKTDKARAHLDLWVEHTAPVIAAMLAAGASAVASHDLGEIANHVMLDPAGNEYCVIGPD